MIDYVFDIQCWAILLAFKKYFTEVDVSAVTGRFAFPLVYATYAFASSSDVRLIVICY